VLCQEIIRIETLLKHS